MGRVLSYSRIHEITLRSSITDSTPRRWASWTQRRNGWHTDPSGRDCNHRWWTLSHSTSVPKTRRILTFTYINPVASELESLKYTSFFYSFHTPSAASGPGRRSDHPSGGALRYASDERRIKDEGTDDLA